MTRKRIAFIKEGLFSHTNTSVGKLLAETFPELELETIDVFDDVLRRNKWVVLMNLWAIARLYGRSGLASRSAIQQCFYQTPFLFHKIRNLLHQRLEGRAGEFAFSFQTQSIYDGSLPGLPHFVYTDHTHLANLDYPGFEPRQLHAPAWIELEKQIYANATRTFTMSKHIERSIVEQYAGDPRRVSCVYAGSNTVIKSVPLNNDNYTNKHILFVGVDWERKGGPELIEAFKRVLHKHPDARLTIVGCSPQISLSNCQVVGRVPVDQVALYYPQASVLCLPSRLEPFGIVCIESYMHKVPVVASRIGALPDFIDHGKSGLLVDPSNAPQFAAALIELIEDPAKCQRFGAAGYASVKDRYTWESVGHHLHDEITAALKPGT